MSRRPPGPSSGFWLLVIAAAVLVLALYCFGKGAL